MNDLIFELKSKLGLITPQISVESLKIYDGKTGKKINKSNELNFNETIVMNRFYPKVIIPVLTTEVKNLYVNMDTTNEFNLQPEIVGVMKFAEYNISGITTKGFKYSLKGIE